MAQRGEGIVTLGEAGKGLWDNILADRIRNTPGGMKKFGPGSGAKFFIDKFLELRGEKHSTEEAVRLASYDLFRLLYSRARTAGMTPQEATKTANRKAKFQARAWVGDLYTPPKGGYQKNPIQNPSDPFFHPRAVKASSFSVTESLDPGTVPHRLLELFWELRKKGFTSKQSLSGVYAWGTSLLSEQLLEEGFGDGADSRLMVKEDLNRQFKSIFGLSEEQIKVFEGTPPYYRQVGHPPGLISIIRGVMGGIASAAYRNRTLFKGQMFGLPEGRFDQALYEKLGQHFLSTDEEARLRASFVPLGRADQSGYGHENLGFRSHLPLRSYLENKFAGTGPRVGQIIPAWNESIDNWQRAGEPLENLEFIGVGNYLLWGPSKKRTPFTDFATSMYPIVAASDDEEAQERAANALYVHGTGGRVDVIKFINIFPPEGHVWPVDILTGETWVDRYMLQADVLVGKKELPLQALVEIDEGFPSKTGKWNENLLKWRYADGHVYTSTPENAEALDHIAQMQVFVDNLILPKMDLPDKE